MSQLFKFDHFFTLGFSQGLHLLVQIIGFLAVLGSSIGLIIDDNMVGGLLSLLIISPLVFLWIRLVFEFGLVFFSINSKLEEIKKVLENQNKSVSE